MAGLAIRSLCKSFGGPPVLDEVTFEVAEGEFCILLGPSGCGKTTLLRVIAGLEEPDRGEVRIGDREVNRLTPQERDVAMVFQSYALYPHLSVAENLAFPLRARRTPRAEIRERVGEAARLLGIEDLLGRRPRQLSGGQRQRVAIGRAIVRNPQLFLFDEPLSNLDAQLRADMRVELSRLHRTLGITTVYVTHDQVEAMTLAEKIVLFREGRIQQVGTPRDLYDRPANLFVATFVGSPTMNLVEGLLAIEEGRAVFRAPGVEIDLGEGPSGGDVGPGPVTLGLRPEVLAPGEGEDGVAGTTEVVEPIGPETLIHVDVEGTRLVAKGPAAWTGEPGSPVTLRLGPGPRHLFRDGKRLEWNG